MAAAQTAGPAPQKVAPAAPSDEPTPTEGASDAITQTGPLRLRGFDLELSMVSSSGVFFAGKSYTNTLSLSVGPSFAIGRRFFEGRWLAPLAVNLLLPIEVQLAGADPRFNGRGFKSSNLHGAIEQIPIDQAQQPPAGYASGLAPQYVLVGDFWLGLTHGKLFTIPRANVTFGAGLRTVLPTSTSSRNAGLITAASAGVFAERAFGPVTVGYSVRPTKYFFTRSSPRIIPLSETTIVNGREEPVWRPDSTGVANPDWAVVHGLGVGVDLPAKLGVSASYLLYHVAPLRSPSCEVEGVWGADTCRDGPLVGPVNRTAMRDDQWFTLEVDWKPKLVTVALGVSTYRPLMQTSSERRLGPEGCASAEACQAQTRRTVAQPFFSVDRNNYTTLYLSITASAEQLAQAFTESP